MTSVLEQVTKMLLGASSAIEHLYFKLPVAGITSTIYRERVYCYELYHRWKSSSSAWNSLAPYILCGELSKRKHLFVKGNYLTNSIPDFLVHHPGQMDNLLAMEVKSSVADHADMAQDLAKLTAFRRDLTDTNGDPANYQAAFFWIYGCKADEWRALRQNILQHVIKADVDASLLRCFIHEQPGASAREVCWSDTESE